MAPSRASASRALLRAFLARARASTAPPRARVAPWRVLEPRLEPARAAGAVARSGAESLRNGVHHANGVVWEAVSPGASWSSIVRSPRGFAGASAGRERKKSPLPAPLEDETEGEEEKDARKTTTTEPTKEEARRAGEGDEDAKKLAAPARFSDLEDVSARAVALLAARVCWLKYVTLGVFKFMYDPHFHVSPLGGCEFTTNAKRAYRLVLDRFAANDMNALRAMTGDAVFAAFRDTWIEYDRKNLSMAFERGENLFAVMTGVRPVRYDANGAALSEIERMSHYAESSPEFARAYPAAAANPAHAPGGWNAVRVTVYFKSDDVCVLVDKVSEEKTNITDPRGAEWTFERVLPEKVPTTAPVTTPWKLVNIE